METNKKYSIKTFGCKVNTYDSALIQKNLAEGKWKETALDDFTGEIVIVNTCAVTEEAVKESQRWIKKHRKRYPHKYIVVTGCAAQVETEKFSQQEEVDKVVANSHKPNLLSILNNSKQEEVSSKQKTFKSSIFKQSHLGEGGSLESSHSRLFLKIQDGCNSFCSFCIIPFARGKSRSLNPKVLVQSVQKHYREGVREVVLTGVHIGDYQFPKESQKGLADLVQLLLKKTQMPRIRLSSLEPIELTDKLLELFSSPRICPHFHLSIQSANTDILQQMKRKYSCPEVEKALFRIHKTYPKAFVGMDIIAGFAGETQKQFETTYSLLADWPWTKMHVFPYSPRRYTYAQKAYTSWPRSLIMKRASLLRHLSAERFKEQSKRQIGTIKQILPLKNKEGLGISKDYWTVQWKSQKSQSKYQQQSFQNKELTLRINSVDDSYFHLNGVLL